MSQKINVEDIKELVRSAIKNANIRGDIETAIETAEKRVMNAFRDRNMRVRKVDRFCVETKTETICQTTFLVNDFVILITVGVDYESKKGRISSDVLSLMEYFEIMTRR